jgi:hypothetical protein
VWVRKNTSAKWGRTFLEGLSATVKAGAKETEVTEGKGKVPKRKGSESDKGFDSGVEVESGVLLEDIDGVTTRLYRRCRCIQREK